MGAPTLYRWDDAGAPEMGGHADDRSGIALFKAILVDGYGTKSGAGWTLEYEDVALGIAVFRNNPVTGTGMYLQVREDGSIDTYYGRAMTFHSFEEMSSATEGTFQMPSTVSGCVSRKSMSLTANNRSPWYMIADDRCFYLFVATNNYTGTVGSPGTFDPAKYDIWFTFVGDIESFHPDDHYCFAMVSASSYSANSNFGSLTGFNGAALPGHYMQRNAAGDSGYSSFYPLQSATTYMSMGGSYNTTCGLPHPWNGQTILNRALINDGVAYSLRGRMPGLYYPSHRQPWDLFEEFTFEGKNMMAVRWLNGSYWCSGCIDMGATFRE